MKRKELMKLLAKAGATFKEGGNHTKIYIDGKYVSALPRHKEIKQHLAENILASVKRH